MKHWLTYPLAQPGSSRELLDPAALLQVARAVEAAGFDGIGFTDHPAPSQKWLDGGGHDALDPFVALSAVAVVTERLRLVPNIVVLPYRNPFLVAKAAATLDLLSGGRFVLSVATGYLRSEYRALGVDFEQRNALFDEALEVLRGVWTQERFAYEGTGFTARDVTANPRPGHLPVWIGGNSALTRRRVARSADGWNPFRAPAWLAATARTPPLETLEELAPMLDDLWAQVERAGRDRAAVDVAFSTGLPGPATEGFDAGAELERLDALAALGVTWNGVTVPGDSLAHALEAVEQYGREVVGRG